MKRLSLLATVAALALSGPAAAQLVAITNGKVATLTAVQPIEGATIIVRDGRIAAVGRDVAVPAGADIVDAGGKWVTPGIIAAFSRLGVVEVDAVDETDDADASKSPFSAAIDITPGINARSVNIPINRIEGLTRAIVSPIPGHDVFVGQGAIISLADAEDVVTRSRAFQFIELGERGADLAGGSRGAAHLNLKNGLREAIDYARNPSGYEGGKDTGAILTRLDVAALVPVVQGRMPMVVHVERSTDILRLLELRREFPALKLIIVGGGEGWMVAQQLAAAKVPVIATALADRPGSFETLGATESNVGRMVKAGVTVALGMIDDNDTRQVRLLPQHAGNLVAMSRIAGATGLSHAEALATITKAPAEIFGMTDLGTIEAGKRADIVIWDGDPLELASAPVMVMIDGKSGPLVSRQTKLRDRYMPKRPTDMPEHYRY